jgi:hypothetical protein
MGLSVFTHHSDPHLICNHLTVCPQAHVISASASSLPVMVSPSSLSPSPVTSFSPTFSSSLQLPAQTLPLASHLSLPPRPLPLQTTWYPMLMLASHLQGHSVLPFSSSPPISVPTLP